MDAKFLDTWRSWALIGPSSPVPGRQSIYITLTNILARTPKLHSLRICVGETGCARSASKLALCRATGLPFGPALTDAIQVSAYPNLHLFGLRKLEMDGFEDISGLVALAPNLVSLRACLSAGLSQRPNVDLIHVLKYVPKLRDLTYIPESLRVQNVNALAEVEAVLRPQAEEARETIVDDDEDEREEKPEVDESVLECVRVLGQLLPELERLDLQTTWFGNGTTGPSKSEPVNAKVCPVLHMSVFICKSYARYAGLARGLGASPQPETHIDSSCLFDTRGIGGVQCAHYSNHTKYHGRCLTDRRAWPT